MSMELELVFVNNCGRGFKSLDVLLAINTLSLDRDYGLFAQIDKDWMGSHGKGIEGVCSPKLMPPGIDFQMLDEEKGWATETENMYGELLKYVTAKELCRVDLKEQTQWNKAVFAMVKALPPESPVVLWWH